MYIYLYSYISPYLSPFICNGDLHLYLLWVDQWKIKQVASMLAHITFRELFLSYATYIIHSGSNFCQCKIVLIQHWLVSCFCHCASTSLYFVFTGTMHHSVPQFILFGHLISKKACVFNICQQHRTLSLWQFT